MLSRGLEMDREKGMGGRGKRMLAVAIGRLETYCFLYLGRIWKMAFRLSFLLCC